MFPYDFLISFFISVAIVFMICRFGYGLDKAVDEKSHAMHTHEVSRLGGIGVVTGIAVSALFFSPSFMTILIAGVAIFVFGFLEDKYHFDLPYNKKIGFMVLSTLILLYMTHEYAYDGGFVHLDKTSTVQTAMAFVIALVGIVGFSSAVNFIDGLNGYAMGVVFITLAFFGVHFHLSGMNNFLTLVLIFDGAILGFLVLNFPFGRIFLGDMGAHLIGFMVGFICIAMTNHDSGISLWYPLAAFAFAIVNTLQKFPRRIKRKKLYGTPFGESDSEDLHYFMFQYVKKHYPNIENGAIKNSIASVYILVPHFVLNLIAFVFRNDDIALVALFAMASALYLIAYNKLQKYAPQGKSC